MKIQSLGYQFVLFALLALFSTQSCTTNKFVDNDHNAQNSLDYDGIYRGTLPCADCEGIKTTIYLNRNNTFKRVSQYIGRDVKDEKTGVYQWNTAGNTVVLKSANNQDEYYFVGENTLTMLDTAGKKIDSPLSKYFVLTKDNYALLNKKWRLVELMGQKVDISALPKKEAYIQFSDSDDRYSASVGCNTLVGQFKVLPMNKIELKNGISTMMACPDMTLEGSLGKVLESADGFQINGDQLILIKGRMAPLAVFRIPMN